jgi:hypothetical protein
VVGLFLEVIEACVDFFELDHLVGGNLLLQTLEVLGQIEELFGLEHLLDSFQ